MEKMTRRRVLGAGASAGTAALAGCSVDRAASFETWTPTEGTWPLARYDPGNTGYNPHATPPRDGVKLVWEVAAGTRVAGLVVTPDLVVAHGEDGLVVIPKTGPDPLWRESTPAEAAGFYPHDSEETTRLYASGATGRRNGKQRNLLRAWDDPHEASQAFEQRYAIRGDGAEPTTLVGGRNSLYVGHDVDGRVVAFDAEGGEELWRVTGNHPALIDGTLLAGGSPWLRSYRPRSRLNAWLNDDDDRPKEAWRANGGDQMPALVDGQVFAGEQSSFSDMIRDDQNLHGYDAETGDPLWEPLALGDRPMTPAVVGNRGYVGVLYYEDREEKGYIPSHGELVALDLRDGSVVWRRETEWWQWPAVVGGDVVVARGGELTEEAGRIRAYDADSGDVLWTFATSSVVDAVALVDSTVYAGLRDGTVYALRAT